MFRAGYLTIGSWRGAPIRLHWSIPVAALIFGGFDWSSGFFVGFILVILVHELGHALAVSLFGHRVVGVDVTGFGGACRWSGNAKPFERSAIAWGGILAQLLLWVATLLWLHFFGAPRGVFGWDLVAALDRSNLWLIAINLIPVEPFDGARAWGIFRGRDKGGPRGLPAGTWRDHSHVAQRRWLDRLEKRPRRKGSQKPQTGGSSVEVPLSRGAARAIDDLLRHTTGTSQPPKDDQG